jgi:Co/Zn/Cd efflux system component
MMNRALGVIYLIGSLFWMLIMLPVAFFLGYASVIGYLGEIITATSFWDYPVKIAGCILSLLMSFLVIRFGITLIKDSFHKIMHQPDNVSSVSGFRKRLEKRG